MYLSNTRVQTKTKPSLQNVKIMAHWFHRNPLKATATVNFEFRGITADGRTHAICRYVSMIRPIYDYVTFT